MTGDMYATDIWSVPVLHDMDQSGEGGGGGRAAGDGGGGLHEKAEVRVSSLSVEPLFSVYASEARKRGEPGSGEGSLRGGSGSNAKENEVTSSSLSRGSSYLPLQVKVGQKAYQKAYRPSPVADYAIIHRPEAEKAKWGGGGCDIGVFAGGGGDGGLVGCSSPLPPPHPPRVMPQPQHSSESLLPRRNTVLAKETYYEGKRDLAPDAAAVGVAEGTVTQMSSSYKPQMFGGVKVETGAALARMPFRELQRGGITGTTHNVRSRHRG